MKHELAPFPSLLAQRGVPMDQVGQKILILKFYLWTFVFYPFSACQTLQ